MYAQILRGATLVCAIVFGIALGMMPHQRAVAAHDITAAETFSFHARQVSVQGFQYTLQCNPASLTADFAAREAMPQTELSASEWYVRNANGNYIDGGRGPRPLAYPQVKVPANAGCDDATWKRERILIVALHYLNIPGNPHALTYRHHHIPAWNPPTNTYPSNAKNPVPKSWQAWGAGTGLDCSNYTAWVYNFGLGIKFTSDVRALYADTLHVPARAIPKTGPFQLGDVLYLHPRNNDTYASHAVIYLDDAHVIDVRLNYKDANGKPQPGVQIRPRHGWYRNAVLGGWRIITE